MKILGVNDIHASRKPPSSCTDTYWPDLMDLLLQTVEVARARGVGAVVWTGDVFHHKEPHRTDHAVVKALKKYVIEAYLCPVLAVAGNHDMKHDRIDSVEETQPLGVLAGRGGLQLLDGWAGDNFPLFGVPWQQEWSEERIRAVTAGFRESVFSRTLVVTHAPIYPPGSEPRYEGAEVTPAKWWADALEPGHGLVYGHIHEPHGTYEVGGVTFCNYGALSRGSLDEYNLERQVGCTIWDDDTGEFEFVLLKAKPADQVFRLREHDEVVTAQRRLDKFLAGVNEVTLELLSVESVVAHIKTLGLEPDVVDLAEEMLMAQQGSKR